MKNTLVLILLTGIVNISLYSQNLFPPLADNYKQQYKLRFENHAELLDLNENITPHLKIDNRDKSFNVFNKQEFDKQQRQLMISTPTNDFLVNDDTTGTQTQRYPAIAVTAADDFIVVWEDGRNGNYDIYFQRYSSNGSPQGVNTKVNDDLGIGGQYYPSVAVDGAGNFVIVWYDFRNGNYDIYFQRFNSNGTTIGVNTKVNDDAANFRQWYPSIAMNAAGNFVIAWVDFRNNNFDIYFQRYDSNGIAQGINTKVNDDVGNTDQWYPSVAIDAAGNFAIAWEDGRSGNQDIYFQRYNSFGTAIGTNKKANDDTGKAIQWYPSIAMDGFGSFVIAWMDYRNNNFDIYLQRFNSDGITQGVNSKVNDDVGTKGQFYSSVAMDASGNFVVVWIDNRSGNNDIYFQRYDNLGINQGANRKVNDDAGTAWQGFPSVSMSSASSFAIVWEDTRNDNYDIYFQRYNSEGTILGTNNKVNDDFASSDQSYPSIAIDNSGNFVVTWCDFRNGNSDIYFQRFNSLGVPQGINRKVNSDVGNAQHWSPSIAMDKTGNFVITWYDNRLGNYDIYFQRFNSEGTALGGNSKVNTDVWNNWQGYPSIAMDGLGNFVIVWEDSRDMNSGIYFQRYSSTGAALGQNTLAYADLPAAGQVYPSVVMDDVGNFVIAWVEYRYGDRDIYCQRFNSNGIAQGTNIKANDDTVTAMQQNLAVAMDMVGNFTVVWEDFRNGNSDIYCQQYSPNGTPIGTNKKVNNDVGSSHQWSPSIAAVRTIDSPGNFVIVWEDWRAQINNPNIMGQRYFSNGIANGTNFNLISDGINHGEVLPAVTANNNKIFLAWSDNRRSKGWDIYTKTIGWIWNETLSIYQENNLPMGFSLSQNYPNPFNPATRIQYQVSPGTQTQWGAGSNSYVTLKVYDVLGNEVATLVDEYKPAGTYEVEFPNLETRHGVSLPSGVYFYQLKAGDFVETKKMLLLR